METTMQKTWKPTTAGILNIVTGVLSLLSALDILQKDVDGPTIFTPDVIFTSG